MSTLDELEKLEKAAARAPWTQGDRDEYTVMNPQGQVAACEDCNHIGEGAASAAFIAAARNALPAMIKIAKAVADMDPKDREGLCHFCCNTTEHTEWCGWVAASKLAGGGS